MLAAPFIRTFRLLRLPLPSNLPTSPKALLSPLIVHIVAALKRLDTSVDPRKTLDKLSRHPFTIWNTALWIFLVALAAFTLYLNEFLFLQILIPTAYILAMLIPATSQFVLPATPILAWLLLFFSAKFIPAEWRPEIHVVLLPTLESVLYGANISDILTRYTHPVLDILAWLPYGVMHFVIPFVLAAVLWVFAPKGAVQFFGKAFGFLNLTGVLIQLVFPCAAPWYEIIHGLTPADYAMSGSPGGLMRIDRIFGGTGYTNTFGNAPLVFGAFPSLHAGTSTMEALFLTYFFPKYAPFYWAYAGTLYWATMYLTHHYLVDVVGGGCLALACFYYFMPKEFKDLDTGITWDAVEPTPTTQAEDYELVDEDEAFDQAMDLAGAKVPYHNSSEPRRAEEGQSSRPTMAPKSTSEANVTSTSRKEGQNRLRSVSSSNVKPGEGSTRRD
ncbi:Phosphatidylinositol:ceramide phosphoinositol transferase (IPC synthase) [Naganishia albida]|nr:Phosphatidylinositol:ceramide phosphoinositol transferase (IPC synthase) [Naganishia albida]